MQSSFTIIGVGSPIIDIIAQVEDSFVTQIGAEKGGMTLVDEDSLKTLLAKTPNQSTKTTGGSAGNTVFTLARMGNSARFLGKTGNCAEGHFYRNHFSSLGGDTSSFKVGNVINGQCLSLVTPDGERTFRTHLGAAMSLTPEEISVADFKGCNHAHIEGYLLFDNDLMMHILKCAKAAKCTISLDLASFDVVKASGSLLAEILNDYVDIVFANEMEAAAFTGLEDSYPTMAKKLAEYCDIAAVKVGAQGAYIASQGEVIKVEAIPVSQVVDTTGAGDLWAAGFLHGWSRNHSLAKSAKIGALLGSAVVQIQGSVLPEDVWNTSLREIEKALSLESLN
ncbi:MAG: sugar/nucleoside kinase (ribokinase family) [Lentimonas sp.]|jgi:sugar/nucleoside kinase (ribokinase family)